MSSCDQEYTYCCICREKYLEKTLYCCYNNHFFCPKCYKQEYYKGKEKRCPQRYCSSWISVASNVDMKSGDERTPRKMFPHPRVFSEKKSIPVVGAPISVTSTTKSKSNTSITSLSKKPANCPHFYCNKSVAINSIDAHFRYEHQDVPIISAYLNGRNGLELHPNDIKYNEKLCIVLINLIEPDGPTEVTPVKNTVSSISKNLSSTSLSTAKPTLILLATRIPCYDTLDNEEEDEEVLLNEEGENPGYDYDACSPEDKIIIWLASNVATKYSYTIAASTICNNYRIKYFGPIQTLNERDSKKIFEEGRCMILSHNQFMGMTENGQKYFVLHLVVHGDD